MRSFTAQSLIALPVLSAPQAAALATQLETHAKGHKLSPEAAEALRELVAARGALEAVHVAKVTEVSSANPAAVAADRVLDRAWGAVNELITAWVHIDDKKLSPLAKEIEETVFGAGTAFLKAKFHEEWAESRTRLTAIEEKGLDAHFAKLGAEVFLTTLKRAHAAYGKALGVTETKEAPAAAPRVKEALDEVGAAMREYVVKVSAMVSRKNKASSATVEALLAPLTQWQSSRSAPVDAPVVAPPLPATPAVTAPDT